MKLTLRQLQQVVVLAEHGHFGRAAEALHLSQPALTRGIQGLEAKLGTLLFTRSPAGAAPTDAGHAIVERARAILSDCDDLERSVGELVSDAQRILRVAVGHYPAELCVVDVVAQMLREEPRIKVSVRAVDWARCVEMLVARQVEVAVCETSELPEGSGLRHEPLGRHRVYFLCREGHPLLGEAQVTLDAAFAYPWTCSPLPARAIRNFPTLSSPAGALDAAEGVFVPAVHSTSLPLSFRLAANSDALALAPLSLAEEWLLAGRLKPLAYAADWFRLHYGFVWSTRRPPVGAAVELMNRLQARERQIAEREAMLADRWGVAG